MQTIAISASVLVLAQAVGISPNVSDKQSRFAAFTAKNNKSYKSAKENDARFAAWSKKDDEINNVNSNPKNTFVVGHNKFSDKLPEELASMFIPQGAKLGKLAQVTFDSGSCHCPEGCTQCACNDFGIGQIDSVFSWNTTANPLGHSAVNPVENQGSCNSCWAFAAMGVAESQHHITNSGIALQNFAEQFIIDCNPYGYACPTGGSSRTILQWMSGSPAIQPVLEKDYPYNTPGSAGTCNTSKPKYNATVTGIQ